MYKTLKKYGPACILLNFTITEEEQDPVEEMGKFSNSVKIVVPEGMIVGVNPDNMHSVTWQYKVRLKDTVFITDTTESMT